MQSICTRLLLRTISTAVLLATISFISQGLLSPLSAAEPEPSNKIYEPTWKSLASHVEAPEWFKDAKFGIYCHWGVYSVPAFGNEWYPRWMHYKGHPFYEHHVKTYGEPSKFGYHDFVPMFKAEKFDANEWAELWKKAGARFAGPVAEHHDGFSMWECKITPWYVNDKGPKRDISGELEKAIRSRGMKFIGTFHHARNLQRPDQPGEVYPKSNHFPHSHYPPVEGMPTSSDDPELIQLYGRMPEKEWVEKVWFGKLKEFIDGYHPDLIWFDVWLDKIPEAKRQEYVAYYFNEAKKRNQDVVIARKGEDLPNDVSVEDFEKGRMKDLSESWWLTDDTISNGSWCYTEDLKIKESSEILHVLIDIVSKRGVLLLNISPKADGTIPDDQRKVLLEIGDWLGKYGEAIYNTRPWIIYGEGPTQMDRGGHFVKSLQYKAEDVRYTRSKDGATIYAISLGSPKPGESFLLKSFSNKSIQGDLSVKSISLLGSNAKVAFEQTDAGLKLTVPAELPDAVANVFKIEVSGSAKVRPVNSN